MLRKVLFLLGVGAASLFLPPMAASAAVSAQAGGTGITLGGQSGGDFLEAREFRLADARVAGRESALQTVIAWEVTTGSWNGESLDGLSLIMVVNKPDNAGMLPTTNCYISHMATPAQRNALLSAFFAAKELKASDVNSLRIEPAVIRFEVAGHAVIVHLGLVA